MYADDIMGISKQVDTVDNLAKIKTFVENVFGKGALSEAKTISNLTELVMIGYSVNIITKTVRMSEQNRWKTIRILFRVNENDSMTVLDLMRVASYASRYSKICPLMTPYSSHIYSNVRWRTNIYAIVIAEDISIECKQAIQLWRIVIAMMELRKEDSRFYRTFESFIGLQHTQYKIEFDASLTGAGIIVSKQINNAWTILRIASISYTDQYDFSKQQYQSSNQNACEFIAAILGTIMAITLGARNGVITLVGDSTTALRWAEEWRFRSGPSSNAAVLYVALGLKYNIRLNETIFVRGEDNTICDALSRGTHPKSLGFQDKKLFSCYDSTYVGQALKLCDPTSTITTNKNLVMHWGLTNNFVDSLEYY
jgi:hypothetical protein